MTTATNTPALVEIQSAYYAASAKAGVACDAFCEAFIASGTGCDEEPPAEVVALREEYFKAVQAEAAADAAWSEAVPQDGIPPRGVEQLVKRDYDFAYDFVTKNYVPLHNAYEAIRTRSLATA